MPGSERSSSRAFQRYLKIAIGQVVREQQRSLGPGRHRLFLSCTILTTSLWLYRTTSPARVDLWSDPGMLGRVSARRRRRPDGVGLGVAPSVRKKRSVQRLCLGNRPSESDGRGICATSWTSGVDRARVHRTAADESCLTIHEPSLSTQAFASSQRQRSRATRRAQPGRFARVLLGKAGLYYAGLPARKRLLVARTRRSGYSPSRLGKPRARAAVRRALDRKWRRLSGKTFIAATIAPMLNGRDRRER